MGHIRKVDVISASQRCTSHSSLCIVEGNKGRQCSTSTNHHSYLMMKVPCCKAPVDMTTTSICTSRSLKVGGMQQACESHGKAELESERMDNIGSCIRIL